MKSRHACRKSARKAITAYLSDKQKSLKTLAWNIYHTRGAGLTKDDFEYVLAGFEAGTRIEEIRDIIEKTDVFGSFKGTRELWKSR